MTPSALRIRNRDGQIVALDFEQIRLRIEAIIDEQELFAQSDEASTFVSLLLERVLAQLNKLSVTVINTSYIDDKTIEICVEMGERFADAAALARCLDASNMQKVRKRLQPLTAAGYVAGMRSNFNPYDSGILSWLDDRTSRALMTLPAFIDYASDHAIPAEGLLTLRKQYLYKTLVYDTDGSLERDHEGGVRRRAFELPCEMYARMAIQMTGGAEPAYDEVLVNYHYLKTRICTMSTPVMTRAGTPKNSLAACFLTFMRDSIRSIYNRLGVTADLSSGGGGIALEAGDIRERGGYLCSTGGEAQGLLQFAGLYETSADCVSQGPRRGSTAVYCPDWHPDVQEFSEARSETGSSIKRPTLFIGLMVSSLFLRRAATKRSWTLFPPALVPDLARVWGDAFEARYIAYEREYAKHPLVKRIDAREFLLQLSRLKIESGFPYLINRDAAYEYSNQKHLMEVFTDGRIVFNLCTEVELFMREDEVAVCILGTVVVTFCVHYDPDHDDGRHPFEATMRREKTPLFDFTAITPRVPPLLLRKYHPELGGWLNKQRLYGRCGSYVDLLELGYAAYQQCIMLNHIFEHNLYLDPGAKRCSQRDRPIGIGQQGLFDLYTMLLIEADTPRGMYVNRVVQGVIYFFALLASSDFAREYGRFATYEGSPISQGKFQFDLRNDYALRRLSQLAPGETPTRNRWMENLTLIEPIDEVNWEALRSYIGEHGTANGTLTSIQPTETSAKISRISEMCEPRRGNKLVIRNEQQTTIIRNPHLTRLCKALGYDPAALWNYIGEHEGSIIGAPGIPPAMQKIFRTVFEYDPCFLLKLTAERESYIDMAQSHNVYLGSAKVSDSWRCIYYALFERIKSMTYYTRVPAASTLRATSVNSGLIARQHPQDITCVNCST